MAEPDGEAAGRGDERAANTVRPVVLPETFDGTKNWDDWYLHFENVAAVNGWDDAEKLKWLRVRLTGRAQKALHRLPEASRATYEAALTALKARFEPDSRQARYHAELQSVTSPTGDGRTAIYISCCCNGREARGVVKPTLTEFETNSHKRGGCVASI